MSDLLKWFTQAGASYNQTAMELRQVEGMGWGAFALRDISVYAIP